jgi:hypothetical protein
LDLSLSAILTRSGNDAACIFFITWLRCIFDGGFAGTDFRRNLLVKHAANDQVHHLALANAQYAVPFSQFSNVSLFFTNDAILSE